MKVKPAKESGSVLMEVGPKDEKILSEQAVRDRTTLFKLKKILVPIDFSDCSKKALRYAIPMAKQFQASIVLVHVIQLTYVGDEFGAIDYNALEKELRASRVQMLNRLAADEVRGEVPVESLLRVGHPMHEIVQTAKELDVDLIVISTHGRTGLKHVFLGSVTENVVRHAPCPILTVREHEHEFIAS